VSVIDKARDALTGRDKEDAATASRVVPKDVEDRIQRGRKWMRRDATKRRLCQLFLRGETYFYQDDKGILRFLETRQGVGSGRPAHRVRNVYNMILPMVDAKVSSSTTRVPGYEINPGSTDPEDSAAARLAEKVMLQGYERWRLREARVKAVTLAIGGGGVAYALPYFDPAVGPFRAVEDDAGQLKMQGEGENKCLILNGNEAYGEPGADWYHSRWYAAEVARPLSEVMAMEGFTGAKLTADAALGDLPSDKPTEGMVVVTLYFERPSAKRPQGRMLTIAGNQQIVPEGPYPLSQGGRVIDEPCIHRLVYRIDPTDDNDLGLTWQLIDFQRTYQDCMNKIIELKNRGLLSQLMAPEGSIVNAPTDAPQDILYYRLIGGAKPEWRDPPNPALLAQLMQILERCVADMRYVAADTDVEVAPNVAIGTVQAVIQQAANRWSSFLGDLAEWDSKVARHCLLLAQEHYTEQRILKIRGRFGWEPEASFKGADILGQVDVTVNPATIETHTRQAMLQTLGWIQANFPGYVRPEVAIEIALHGASPEAVVESFEFDKARANEIIQAIRDETIMDWPSRTETQTDPMTGVPVVMSVPSWMPRKWDDVAVQQWVLATWMKTPDFSSLAEHCQEVAVLVYEGFEQLQAAKQAKEMAAQADQAMQLGQSNAARPQEKSMPSTPAPGGEGQPSGGPG
jgi:hypothetical protein